MHRNWPLSTSPIVVTSRTFKALQISEFFRQFVQGFGPTPRTSQPGSSPETLCLCFLQSKEGLTGSQNHLGWKRPPRGHWVLPLSQHCQVHPLTTTLCATGTGISYTAPSSAQDTTVSKRGPKREQGSSCSSVWLSQFLTICSCKSLQNSRDLKLRVIDNSQSQQACNTEMPVYLVLLAWLK